MSTTTLRLVALLAVCALSHAQTDCPRRCLCFRTTVRCMFLGLKQLPKVPETTTILDLRFNEIEHLPAGSFRNMKNLNTLLLNNNQIKSLHRGTFAGLTELKYLYMYKNKIRHISEHAFQDLYKLEQLYLHYNYIGNLSSGTFTNLTSMERLFLHNNKLQRIPYGAFSNLPSLKRLRLDSNALVCDCQLMWLKHMLEEHPDSVTSATCQEPLPLHGRSVTDIEEHMLKCSAPHLTEEPRNVVISFGKTAYFHCEAEGDPQPDIVWLQDSAELDPASRDTGYQILDDGTLMVEPSREPETAVFECMAKNAMGEAKSRPVSVRYVPITPEPDDGMPESDIAVNSVFEEEKEAGVEEEEGPPRRERQSFYNRAGRRFDARNREDNRLFSARRRPFQLFLPAPTHRPLQRPGVEDNLATGSRPRIVSPPRDIRVALGDLAELTCVVDGYPTPQIVWMRAGNAITTQTPRYRLRFAAREANLTIINVQLQDAGEWTCAASNSLGRVSAPAQLIIQALPRIDSPPQGQIVPAGANIDLTCGASGYPQPEISWLLDGRRIEHSSRVAVLAGGGVLRITNVQRRDAGTYTCRAHNSAGVATEDADLDVSGQAGPVLSERPPLTLTASVGDTVALKCTASGSPTPQINWRRVGGNLFADARHSSTLEGVLTLRSLTHQDAGVYECNVDNGVGHAVATTHLQISAAQSTSRPGDRFVTQGVREATRDVEVALNRTLSQLFSQPRHHRRTPHELLRIFRFPTAETLESARAGEIFERALELVKRLVDSGSRFNLSSYSYSDLLSPEQVERLQDLSGCHEHRRSLNCSNLCFHSRYRSVDGTCNNLQNPLWGASLTGFRRILPAQYENGFNTPRGSDGVTRYNGFLLPNPRLVSSRLVASETVSEDDEFSMFLMQWGQFVDHDLDHAIPAFSEVSFDGQHECDSTCENVSPCFNIPIPPSDTRQSHHRCMRLVRSSAACGSGSTSVFSQEIMPREQINGLTSYIDGSQIYGNTETQAHHLRNLSYPTGRLRNGIFSRPHRPFMPFNDGVPVDCQRDQNDRSDIGCFMAGDVRANEQLGLSAMHTVWLREHNRVADELSRLNPQWHSEELYQEARRIVGAQLQHITYEHWLPLVLGEEGMRRLGTYRGYDPSVDASIANGFATAAFRFGHGLVGPVLYRLNETFQPIPQGNLPLHRAFFAPWRLVQEGGIDPIIRGLFANPAKRATPDQLLTTELTEKLFSLHHQVSLDLAAMNMQRGRDHGVPGYNAWRRQCGLRQAVSFTDFAREIQSARARDELRQLYGHPDNVDLWVGGMLESHAPGAKMGPTFACIVADQFRRLRDGDRFWYENAGVFTAAQRAQLRQANLARILCDNGDDLRQISPDVFRVPERQQQQQRIVSCRQPVAVDLRLWVDCKTCRGEDCVAEAATPGRVRRSALLSAHSHDYTPAQIPDLHQSSPPQFPPTSVLDSSLTSEASEEAQEAAKGVAASVAEAQRERRQAEVRRDIYHVEDVTEERIQGLEEMLQRMHRQLTRVQRQLRHLHRAEKLRRAARRRQRRQWLSAAARQRLQS